MHNQTLEAKVAVNFKALEIILNLAWALLAHIDVDRAVARP